MKNEDKWNLNVTESKKLVVNSRNAQMSIAKLALEVCEVFHGGDRRVETTSSRFTIKRFADEIGINSKTLSQWCAVRKDVFNKIDDITKITTSFCRLLDVAASVPTNATRQEVTKVFHQVLSRNGSEQKLYNYLENLRSIASNFNETCTSRFSKEAMEETYFYAQLICDKFAKHKIKPKDNNLIKTEKNRYLALHTEKSYNASGGAIHSGKDLEIIKALVKHKDFISPSELGKEVFPLKTKLAAKLTALRTLQKLAYFKKVEHNSKGHYKWIAKLTPNEVSYEV